MISVKVTCTFAKHAFSDLLCSILPIILKSSCLLLVSVLLLFCIETRASTAGDSTIPEKKRKAVQIHRIPEDAAWLRITNGGRFTLFPPDVIGVRKLESDGFRFVPAAKAPEGMMPQEHFEKRYTYNPLIKEIFIPYSEISSVRLWYGITIKTKGAKKYRIRCLHPKKVAQQIRAHLTSE